MERYIRYRRIKAIVLEDGFDAFLAELVREGWEIIHYQEGEPIRQDGDSVSGSPAGIPVTIIVGKRQSSVI